MSSEGRVLSLGFLHPQVFSAVVTCSAVPFQVEGTLLDGRSFYFRDRHGYASLGIGNTLQEAIRNDVGGQQVDEFAYDVDVLRYLLAQALNAPARTQPSAKGSS